VVVVVVLLVEWMYSGRPAHQMSPARHVDIFVECVEGWP
jgi:hypothetical protein